MLFRIVRRATVNSMLEGAREGGEVVILAAFTVTFHNLVIIVLKFWEDNV